MTRPLKFCMVSTFYPPYHLGGDAMGAYRLTEALAERGHHVDVVHSRDAFRLQRPGGPDAPFTHHANVTLHGLETRRPAVSVLATHQTGRPVFYEKKLREVLEDNEYDVIHYHNVSLMGAPHVLRMGRAIKLYTAIEYWLICPTHVLFKFDREACVDRQCLACTLHSRRPPQAWRYTGALRRALEHVDTLIMPSQFALEQHRAQGIDRPMVHIPCLMPYPPEGPAPAGPALPDRPFFVYVGRLERLKGLQDVIRVFETYREADLVIVGGGNYRAVLEEQAKGLSHVHFLGSLHPLFLNEIYRRALAVLVPSLCYETFGFTLTEALSHGTPAIARRIGALAENIDVSGGGLTFGTLEECREAMERIRTRPELRAEMGRKGKAAFRALWSPEAHMGRYLDLVESLLGRERRVATDSPAEADAARP